MARALRGWLFVVSLALGCDPTTQDTRGAKCESDSDCGNLDCVAAISKSPKDLAPLPLACGDAKNHGAQNAACELPTDCARGVCLLAGACAVPCRDDTSCGAGERCQAVYARTGAEALQTLHACVARVSLGKSAGRASAVRKAALTVGDDDVMLDPVDVNASTLYVLEHMHGSFPGSVCRPPLCPRALRTADALPITLWRDDADYANGDPPRNPVATGLEIDPVVIALPSGARDALSPAGYVLTLATEQPGDLRVTRLSGAPTGLRLDLNVFYLGALDWQPEGARGPALLADALDRVDGIFAQAGIFVGDVRQVAVPGMLPERGTSFPDGVAEGFAVLQLRYGVYRELPELFELSAGAANSAVNLFFLADIEPRANDGEPEAESGGIPGPLGMHGTAGSGIAIATNMMIGDPDRLGRTLAHELGHYLGLFHTSEADGRVLDPLADTPECRKAQDVAGNGLDAADCEGYGADNLMFWAKTTGTVLTADQQTVLRRALVLQ